MAKATAEQLRGNLSGFKKAVRRRDIELVRLRDQHDVMLAALKAAAPHVPVQIQAQVINAINLAMSE